jgi:cytochrome P450
VVAFDPFSYEVHLDPYPTYAALRASAPAYYNEERDVWALSRFADVQAAARDWRTFSNAEGVNLDAVGEVYGEGNFLDADPPWHDQLRDVVRGWFTPKGIAALEPFVRARAVAFVDALRERGDVDLATELCWTLPVQTIGHVIGLPTADLDAHRAWAQAVLERDPGSSAAPSRALDAVEELRSYLGDLLEERRGLPAGDLLTTVAQARVAGRPLSQADCVAMLLLLFVAGTETTASFLGNSFLLLARFPEQRAKLAETSLIPAAVEELLRFEAPIQHLARTTTRSVELHGRSMPAGARVLLLYASANRDERRYPHADVLDIDRAPRRHLSFGEGIHHCLGAPLARLESRVALEVLLPVLGDYQPRGEPQRLYTHESRPLTSLQVSVG